MWLHCGTLKCPKPDCAGHHYCWLEEPELDKLKEEFKTGCQCGKKIDNG